MGQEGRGMNNKKPKPINKSPMNRCIYNPADHGKWLNLQNQQKDEVCGEVTGNGGENRYFCIAHHKQLSGGEEI